jgi:hypothetical protein
MLGMDEKSCADAEGMSSQSIGSGFGMREYPKKSPHALAHKIIKGGWAPCLSVGYPLRAHEKARWVHITLYPSPCVSGKTTCGAEKPMLCLPSLRTTSPGWERWPWPWPSLGMIGMVDGR